MYTEDLAIKWACMCACISGCVHRDRAKAIIICIDTSALTHLFSRFLQGLASYILYVLLMKQLFMELYNEVERQPVLDSINYQQLLSQIITHKLKSKT